MVLVSLRWRQLLQKLRVAIPLPPAGRLAPAPVRFWHATGASYRLPESGHGPAKGRRGWDSNRSSCGAGGDEEEDEDGLDIDEDLLEPSLPTLPLDAQKVFIVHPAVKWGPGKPQLTTGVMPDVRHSHTRKVVCLQRRCAQLAFLCVVLAHGVTVLSTGIEQQPKSSQVSCLSA